MVARNDFAKFINLKLSVDFKHFNQLFLIAVQNCN